MKSLAFVTTILGFSLFTHAETVEESKSPPTHKYQIRCAVGINNSDRPQAVQIRSLEFSTLIMMRNKNGAAYKGDAYTKSGLTFKLFDNQGKLVVMFTGDDTVFGRRFADIGYSAALFTLRANLNVPAASGLTIRTYRDLQVENGNTIESISADLGNIFNPSLSYDRPIPPLVSVVSAAVSNCVTRITKL